MSKDCLDGVHTEKFNPVSWMRKKILRTKPDSEPKQPNTSSEQARRSIIYEVRRNPNISTDELCKKVGIKVPTSEDRNIVQLMQIDFNLEDLAMCVSGRYHAIVSSIGSTMYKKYQRHWMETIHNIIERLHLGYDRFCRFRDLQNGYTVKIIARQGVTHLDWDVARMTTDFDSDTFYVEVFDTTNLSIGRVFERLDFKDVAMILEKTGKLPPFEDTAVLEYDEQTEAFLSKHEIFDRYDEQSDDHSANTLADDAFFSYYTKSKPESSNPYAVEPNAARSTAPER